jgi:NAD(P)-dependent dehydrogenase (short-subunit alcohol dehydrogenase family)
VAVNDLDPERADAVAVEIGGIPVAGDVASESGAASVVDAAITGLGGLDGLINNAGIVTIGKLADADLDDWRRVMQVNFESAYLCSRAARGALADGGGSIVNLASIAAVHPNSGTAAYTPSKAAVVALTRQAALEWGPDGIRVNAIAPGMISGTNMTAAESDELRERRGAVMPLRRTGSPGDIAPVAVFLLSDAARYVTGQLLFVDGGWNVALLSFTPRPWD